MTCIACPRGCTLEIIGRPEVRYKISGNQCPKGITYAKQELSNPTRILTSTVATTGSHQPRLAVKTQGELPKKLLFPAMDEIHRIKVDTPKKPGDVIIKNFLDQDFDLVATGDWDGR